MRLFKTHRAQSSQTDLAEDSLRGQLPVQPAAYYLQDNNPRGLDAPGSQQPPVRQTPQRSVDIFDALNQAPRASAPPGPVPPEYVPSAVNPQLPSTSQPSQLEEAEPQRPSPTADDKENKQSRRSYLGAQSSNLPNASRVLGRSVSVRKRQPPPPSLDISSSSRHHQQPQSAIEGPRSAGLVFPGSRPAIQGVTPGPNSSQDYLQRPSLGDYNRSHSSLQHSRESVYRLEKEPPSRESPESPPNETSNVDRNTYIAYQPPKPADQQTTQAYEAYRARPPSQQSAGPPSPVPTHPLSSQPRNTNTDTTSQTQGAPHAQRVEMMARDGQASNPRHSSQPSHNHGHEQGHNAQFLSAAGQRRPSLAHQTSNTSENGHSTPPPPNNHNSKSRDDLSSLDVAALVQKHEELQAKYSKVKKYYFEKDGQVQQLQNIIAHQRLSMNNTALDDNEYQNRFNRLDGAINNFAFNIRKDWKAVPPWLQAVVNKDASTSSNKEMLQVGRACITRWLIDEIFDRFFHPSLEPSLSSQLKIIEKNLRLNLQSQTTTETAQRDDHAAKLSSWRLTTIEGLQGILSSSQAYEYRSQLTSNLVEKLTAALQMNLTEPPPPGLEASVGGIIELAISIAANLPLESRDVCIEYPMPGAFINESNMKLESGLPPLINPEGVNDLSPSNSGDQTEDPVSNEEASAPPPRVDSLGTTREAKKKSIFGGLGNKKPGPGDLIMGSTAQRPSGASTTSEHIREPPKEREAGEPPTITVDREKRIRFAAFVAVEVLGKGKEGPNVLYKAPCFGY